MEWPKLKNIVLLILGLTNLCLLTFVVRWELQDTRLTQQARADAMAFLAGRGVSVSSELVPEEMTLAPKTVERDLTQEGKLAAQLLGTPIQVEARGGDVYRYFNNSGSIQFHSDGAFQASLTPHGFPVGESVATSGQALLGRLDFVGEVQEQTHTTLLLRQLWQDSPLFTQQVTLEFEAGYFTAMSAGRRLVGVPTPDATRSCASVATTLIQLFNGVNALGDVCSRIDTITQGYVSSTYLSGPMLLTPVWRVVTDTGAYQLDTVTGGLTRIS